MSDAEMNEPPMLAEARMRPEMAVALAEAAPAEWRELRYEAASVGGVTDVTATAVVADGRTESLDAPGRVSLLRSKLRKAMYEPGKGTWFSMTLTVTRDGRAEATYNYDQEPWSNAPIVPSAWLADQEKFSRDPQHRPAWLQQKLAEAGYPDDAPEAAAMPAEGGDDRPTPEQQRLIDVGIAHWRKMVPAEAPLGYRLLPQDGAVAVFHMVRGGGTLYIASNESVLFAASSVSPDQALEVFRSGRRSDTSKFRPAGS